MDTDADIVTSDTTFPIPLADLIRQRLDALRLPPDIRPGEPARSWRSIAEQLGVSAQYLTDVYNGRYPPGRKILRALGVRKVEYGVVDPVADTDELERTLNALPATAERSDAPIEVNYRDGTVEYYPAAPSAEPSDRPLNQRERAMTSEKQHAEVEAMASKFHDIYQQEAKRQGDVRHKDTYADLPDNIKEFDRVLARFVLDYAAEVERKARLDEARESPHEGSCCTLWRSGRPCDCERGRRIAELERKG